jgi:hypothetical protein
MFIEQVSVFGVKVNAVASLYIAVNIHGNQFYCYLSDVSQCLGDILHPAPIASNWLTVSSPAKHLPSQIMKPKDAARSSGTKGEWVRTEEEEKFLQSFVGQYQVKRAEGGDTHLKWLNSHVLRLWDKHFKRPQDVDNFDRVSPPNKSLTVAYTVFTEISKVL